MIKILGLDPGLQHTGWGIINKNGNNLSYVAHGRISTNAKEALSIRLNQIHQSICEIIEKHRPQEAAVEETFVNQNPASALKLGMARGVVLFTPASFGLEVFEYSANKVKKAIVGVGHAEKHQVAIMVSRLLPTAPKEMPADASDALAIAICHANYRDMAKY